ncbi:MAG: enoyl-CoA hydratase/isomerase family protein [Acidimicrobiales bacterium]
MGAPPFVAVTRRPDGVAVVRLDRPKVNALSSDLLGQLAAAARDMAGDPPAAVVIWGGERIFSAGADIAEVAGGGQGLLGAFEVAFGALASIPRAVIAAIDGVALGGGCELALACDLRLAADNAELGQPEVRLGLIPGAGGTQRLARLVGPGRAKELVLTGRRVAAAEALAIGLVHEVVPAGKVLDRALALAAELAQGAVGAQGRAKRAIDQGWDLTLAEGLALERRLFGETVAAPEAAAGLRAFLDRRRTPGPPGV